MRRRKFIALLGGTAAVWPLALVAQQPEQVRRIGVLMGIPKDDPQARQEVLALEGGLRQLGWMPGRNLHIEYRWPGADQSQTAVFANELASMRPDILLGRNTPATTALKRFGGDIPVVFVMVVDPLSTRLVESLARPGGNTTGFTNFEHAMAGKWLDLLKDVSPSIQRVAFFFNPRTSPYARGLLDYVKTAAPARFIKPIWVSIEDVAAFADEIAAVAVEPNTGLVALPDAFVIEHRAIMIELAARHRMPAVYPNPICVRDGGLMAYGIDNPDLFYRAATYIDRILKGSNPGELPVQQPTKFQLLINMKTANALGLAVPPTMLALADEVIE